MAGGVKSLEDCRRGKPRLPGDLYLVFPRRSNEFSSITRAFKALSLSLSFKVREAGSYRGRASACSTSREIVDESAYIRSTWRFMRPNRRIYEAERERK